MEKVFNKTKFSSFPKIPSYSQKIPLFPPFSKGDDRGMKRECKKDFFLILIVLFLAGSSLFAQEMAQIQLVVPTPNPVEAGNEVDFQVILLNSGAARWNGGDYYLLADVYDSQKKYLVKTDRLWGEKVIQPGQKGLFFVNFKVPQSWLGEYNVKVSIFYKGRMVTQSDFYSFGVLPFIGITHLPPPVKIGGNFISSYRYNFSTQENSYLGNTSLALFGKFYDSSMSFNSYTSHSEEDKFNLYNILFHFHAPQFKIMVGDIMPQFSKLSLTDIGLRGGYFNYHRNKFNFSVTGAQSAEAAEGTAEVGGSFARYVYGADFKYNVLSSLCLHTSVMEMADDENSISQTGSAVTPVKDNAGSFELIWDPARIFHIEGEYARAKYNPDTQANSEQNDFAYRVKLDLDTGKVSWKNEYLWVQPDFVLLGNPTIINDRQNYFTDVMLKITSKMVFNMNYDFFKDNIKDNPEKEILRNNSGKIEFNFLPLSNQNITFGSGFNQIKAEPLSAADNLNVDYYLRNFWQGKKFSINWGVKHSEFKDKTDMSNDLNIESANLGLQNNWSQKFVSNLGTSFNRSKDMENSSYLDTLSVSLMLNFRIIPQKSEFTFWLRDLKRKGNDPNNLVSSDLKNVNLEWSYAISKESRNKVVFGTGWENFSDDYNPAEEKTVYFLSTHIVLGF